MTLNSRLIGRLPKIGIRPVIDGREQGVRESLEVQTMNMAKAAARLIEENPVLNVSNHTFKSLDNDFKQQTYWSFA